MIIRKVYSNGVLNENATVFDVEVLNLPTIEYGENFIRAIANDDIKFTRFKNYRILSIDEERYSIQIGDRINEVVKEGDFFIGNFYGKTNTYKEVEGSLYSLYSFKPSKMRLETLIKMYESEYIINTHDSLETFLHIMELIKIYKESDRVEDFILKRLLKNCSLVCCREIVGNGKYTLNNDDLPF